jgi:Raf kinase inhibitor-like YbhB/YbcL family protein
MFQIESPDFKEGEAIPEKFTCEGDDLSPLLKWTSPPQGTKSYFLLVEDPDAPMGTFVHWILYDISSSLNEISRGAGNGKTVKDGMKQGLNDFGHIGYGGPCPPKGHGPHRYNFILKALDISSLNLPDGARKSDLERATAGHVLAEARTMGRFKR